MKMRHARTIAAWIWIVGPLLVLCASAWDIAQKPLGTLFSSFGQYTLVWGMLIALAFSGFWTLLDGPGYKWLLRGASIVVAVYMVLMFLISSDWGFHGGAHDYVTYSVLAAVFLFCVVTFIIAGMQPNTTPHSDARDVPAPASAVGARAGGCER
jgi:hypothetical protein